MYAGKLVLGAVVPHTPFMIPEISREKASKAKNTQEALNSLAVKLSKVNPDVLIFITPQLDTQSDMESRAIGINCAPSLNGNLRQFKDTTIQYEYNNDFILAHYIISLCRQIGFPVIVTDRYNQKPLEYSVVAPLYFLASKLKNKFLINIRVASFDAAFHYQLGQVIAKTIESCGQKVAVIASGDLAHNLSEKKENYDPAAKEFDKSIINCLKEVNFDKFSNIPSDIIDKSGEFGYLPIATLLGIFKDTKSKFDLLSYEAPFGLGYMVGVLQPAGTQPLSLGMYDMPKSKVKVSVKNLADLARKAVETYITTKEMINVHEMSLKEERAQKSGVFVTINSKNNLRGCVGTIRAYHENIIEETIQNSISAAVRDKRFAPISKEEFQSLSYAVNIIDEPEVVTDMEEMDPLKYGLIVSNGYRQGILLPNIEGIRTIEEQLGNAMIKADIIQGEPVWLYKFSTKEITEKVDKPKRKA